MKGGDGGAVARWRGDDDVRVLASALCCRRRGEDATINIRWEVGGGRVTKGGFEVVAVRGGSLCRRSAIHAIGTLDVVVRRRGGGCGNDGDGNVVALAATKHQKVIAR